MTDIGLAYIQRNEPTTPDQRRLVAKRCWKRHGPRAMKNLGHIPEINPIAGWKNDIYRGDRRSCYIRCKQFVSQLDREISYVGIDENRVACFVGLPFVAVQVGDKFSMKPRPESVAFHQINARSRRIARIYRVPRVALYLLNMMHNDLHCTKMKPSKIRFFGEAGGIAIVASKFIVWGWDKSRLRQDALYTGYQA